MGKLGIVTNGGTLGKEKRSPATDKKINTNLNRKGNHNMFKDSIDNSPKNSEKISQKLEQVTFNTIRKALPDRLITEACKSVVIFPLFLAFVFPKLEFV